jgi:hypothetical protein
MFLGAKSLTDVNDELEDLQHGDFASYTYFTSAYFPWLPNMGKCAGEEFAALAGIGMHVSGG